MRDLESYIIKVATTKSGTEFEELRSEKCEAMDRYGQKMILYTGAIESLHRRLQDRARGGRNVADRSLTISPSWERFAYATIPAPTGVSNSPISQFTPILQNSSFSHTHNIQPLTPYPPESLSGDQQRFIIHEMQPFVPENYDRPGTSLSDYPQTDEADPTNYRPLSFQRDAVEILQVASHRRRRRRPQPQLPTLRIAEEEVIAPNGHVEAQSGPYLSTPLKITTGASEREVGDTLANNLDEFRPRRYQYLGIQKERKWSNDEDQHKQSIEKAAHHGSNLVVVGDLQEPTNHSTKVEIELDQVAGISSSAAGQGILLEGKTCIGKSSEEFRVANEGLALEVAQSQPSISYTLPPQPYEEKIPVHSPTENDGIAWGMEPEEKDSRDTRCSFDLPIQGLNDEEYCFPKQDPESGDRKRSGPLPVAASELGDTSKFETSHNYSFLCDGSDAPEVVEVTPTDIYGTVSAGNDVNLIPKKKPSRASRLFSSLPGSSVKGSRLSRLGSLRFSTSQSPRTPTPTNFTTIADEGLEVVPPSHPLALRKSQTGPDVQNEKMEILRRHANITYKAAPRSSSDSSPNVSSEPLFSPSINQPTSVFNVMDYDSIVAENVYKLTPKENFLSFLTLDCRHVIYMSNDGFQVFTVPAPHDPIPVKARHTYRLGEAEGLKKGKVPWEYKSGAASRRYIATITKERVCAVSKSEVRGSI